MSTESLFCWKKCRKQIHWGFFSLFYCVSYYANKYYVEQTRNLCVAEIFLWPSKKHTNRQREVQKIASIKNMFCHDLWFESISTIPNSKPKRYCSQNTLTALVATLLVDKTRHWETRSIGHLEQQSRNCVNHWKHHSLNLNKPRILKALFETS